MQFYAAALEVREAAPGGDSWAWEAPAAAVEFAARIGDLLPEAGAWPRLADGGSGGSQTGSFQAGSSASDASSSDDGGADDDSAPSLISGNSFAMLLAADADDDW